MFQQLFPMKLKQITSQKKKQSMAANVRVQKKKHDDSYGVFLFALPKK